MIPDEIVERVREEADAVAIIGEFVKLKRVGASFRGPCPFHQGKNNNFSVSPSGGYKCFVCGASGDVFTFVEQHLGLDFVETVKWIGARAGVDVVETQTRPGERDAREALWEVNATAAEFFRRQLWESPAGEDAAAYLASRNLRRPEADRFQLGFAPRDASAMRAHMSALGFDDDRQMAAGLLVAAEGTATLRSRFRGRLMFPIFDVSGHIAGFGGRVLGGGEPKYLNSAESAIFSKRRLLYGLSWAKQAIRKSDRLIIVEGYFDVIRLMLAGVDDVVAPLGTALTDDQAAMIRKYTKNAFLLYDSDGPGLRATFRAGDQLLASGLVARVVTLPEGEDPDTFVRANGAEGLERTVVASVDVLDRKIQLLQRGGWFADLRRKRSALDKLLPTIRAAADPLLRELYVTRTSEVAGVSRDMLLREVSQPRRQPLQTAVSGPRGSAPMRAAEHRRDRRGIGQHAERELVRMLLHHRRYVASVSERLGPHILSNPQLQQIYSAMTSRGADASLESLAAGLDEDATRTLEELIVESGGVDHPQEIIDGSINAVLSKEIASRLAEIDRLLPLAAPLDQDQLIAEKEQLAARLQTLGRPRWKSFGTNRS